MFELRSFWQLFRPQLVVMISTQDRSGFTRCSPFSWVVPLNKSNSFGVMMRDTSKTLDNLMWYPNFTMSWLKPTPEAAQSTLDAHKGPNSINLYKHSFAEFKTPKHILAFSNCRKLGQVRVGAEPWTHFLVSCMMDSMQMLCDPQDFKPLLHFGLKEFAAPGTSFEVEGY